MDDQMGRMPWLIGVTTSWLAALGVTLLGLIGLAELVALMLLTAAAGAVLYTEAVRRRIPPGLTGWFKNRESADYLFDIIGEAESSCEVMGCSGSSLFQQSGKLLNVLQEKFEQHTYFRLSVLLLAPDATNAIGRRKRALDRDPNVLGPEDINRTLEILQDARDRLELGAEQTFEVRVYDYELVWSVVLVDRKRSALGVYGPGLSGWKWPVVRFDKVEGSLYYGAQEQFDQRWANARRVVGGDVRWPESLTSASASP